MTDLVRPRAILFDWDNTLVDSWAAIHHAINHTLVHFGQAPWAIEETHRRVRKSMRDAFPELFGDRWEEAREVFYAAFVANHLESLKPLVGVVEMLAELATLDLYLGVVSNKTGAFLRTEVAHLGWGDYFVKVVGAGDAAADKPAPEVVALALEDSGIAPGEHVWFVGDTGIDMQCAYNSQCLPVLIDRAAADEAELAECPPRLRFSNCAKFTALVRDLVIPISGASCY